MVSVVDTVVVFALTVVDPDVVDAPDVVDPPAVVDAPAVVDPPAVVPYETVALALPEDQDQLYGKTHHRTVNLGRKDPICLH